MHGQGGLVTQTVVASRYGIPCPPDPDLVKIMPGHPAASGYVYWYTDHIPVTKKPGLFYKPGFVVICTNHFVLSIVITCPASPIILLNKGRWCGVYV